MSFLRRLKYKIRIFFSRWDKDEEPETFIYEEEDTGK